MRAVIEPSPQVERRARRTRAASDWLVFQGILFALHAGSPLRRAPQEFGFGSGMTCLRRLAEWAEGG
ncbi:transposase [Streptomyces albidoflavus]